MKIKSLLLFLCVTTYLLGGLSLKDFVAKRYIPPVRNILSAFSKEKKIKRIKIVEVLPKREEKKEEADLIEYYGIARGAKGRVAVLSINGEPFTVMEGEIILNRYRIDKLYDDRVVLYDFDRKSNIIIKLKEE